MIDNYLDFPQLLFLMGPQAEKLKGFLEWPTFKAAEGSTHNHQAWPGGYLDHVRETMNIAIRLYYAFPERKTPFSLSDALLVLFLHDIEKPFKPEVGHTWKTKEDRRLWRDTFIEQAKIKLSDEQENALRYIEDEHDYSSTERKMHELAAFCHCCDILSARLWYAEGKERKW